MEKLKVLKIDKNFIEFEGGIKLSSYHSQDCCESHELNLGDLTMEDFEGLEFNLSNGTFFRRIPNYGIELIPLRGFSVKIAGHGYNNGYYSDNLDLHIHNSKGELLASFDITECQEQHG